MAEGTGVEPVRACAHEFSRLAHYRPAHLPLEFEVRARIELAHNCFADSCVTTSPTHLQIYIFYLNKQFLTTHFGKILHQYDNVIVTNVKMSYPVTGWEKVG